MTPVLEDQLSKIWSFPIKTEVSQALGIISSKKNTPVSRIKQIDIPIILCLKDSIILIIHVAENRSLRWFPRASDD